MTSTTVARMLDDPDAMNLVRRQDRLATLERVIEDGLPRFVEVGQALMEIREHGLYAVAGHKSFEDYCRDRWEFSTGRARQIIAGAKAVTSGNAEGALTERQARAMARAARRGEVDELREEMTEFVSEHPMPAEPRASDMPEGVRVSRVASPAYSLQSVIRNAGMRDFVERLESAALNEREYAYLLAVLDAHDARAWESARAARKELKAARKRGGKDKPRNDGRQWNPEHDAPSPTEGTAKRYKVEGHGLLTKEEYHEVARGWLREAYEDEPVRLITVRIGKGKALHAAGLHTEDAYGPGCLGLCTKGYAGNFWTHEPGRIVKVADGIDGVNCGVCLQQGLFFSCGNPTLTEPA